MLFFLCCSFVMVAAAEQDDVAANTMTVAEEELDVNANVVPYEYKEVSNFTSKDGKFVQQTKYTWCAVTNPKYNIKVLRIYQNGDLVGEKEILELNDLSYLYSDPTISSCAGNLEITAEVWDLQLIQTTHDQERFEDLLFNNSGEEVIVFSGYSENYKRPLCVK